MFMLIKVSCYNHFQNILRLFHDIPNFISPQLKRCAIITFKHGICELHIQATERLKT